MSRKIPNEMHIRPETRKNFLPGASFGIVLRFVSGSIGALTVLVGLNVFCDIHSMVTNAKVKNLIRIKTIPFKFSCIVFGILLSYHPAICQSAVLPESYEVNFRYSENQESLKTVVTHSHDEVLKTIQIELDEWQNSGYPFAKAELDTLEYSIKAKFVATIYAGPRIVNGALVVHGDSGFTNRVLRNWIRFRDGNFFSAKKFSKLPNLSSHIPFAEEVKVPDLEWFGNQAIIHLYLRKRRNNSFSGILGVLPQANGGGTIVTGNIDGTLSNLFRQGIALDFKWARFAASSQTALISIKAPALNAAGFGLESNFELFRQDSILNKQRADLQIVNTGADLVQFRFGFYASSSSGRLINIDKGLQSVSTRALVFGVKFDPVSASQIRIKRRSFSIEAFPTLKTIRRLEKTINAPQMDIHSNGYLPLLSYRNRFCLQGSWNLGFLSSNEITLPDQFRIGGSRSFRGFNENYFFTSQHVFVELSPQFLLDKSFLFGFFSGIMVYNPGRTNLELPELKTAYNLGVNLELEIGRNIVQVSVANGLSKELPFDYQTTKIHFGYVALF
jgi:hypothetical protein